SSRIILGMLCLLAVVSPWGGHAGGTAAFAERLTGATESAGERVTTIQSVTVEKGADSLAIEIRADGPCTFKQYEFTNPNRLVIDIPGALSQVRRSAIPVDFLAVRAVRVGQFKQQDPAVTRVVLDLEEQPGLAQAFRVRSEKGSIRITLDGQSLMNVAPDARRTADKRNPGTRAKRKDPIEE